MSFREFADHWFGSWVINGLSVVAFFLVVSVLLSRAPDNGIFGAVKGAWKAK